MADKPLFIGEVAKATGVNPKTLRYYEEIGLLPEPRRERNNYRVYSQDAIERLDFIKKAQGLGFALREIKEIFTLRDRGFKPCTHVRDLLRQRLVALEARLRELGALKRELERLEDEWSRMKIVEDDKGAGICPQIEGVKTRIRKKGSGSAPRE